MITVHGRTYSSSVLRVWLKTTVWQELLLLHYTPSIAMPQHRVGSGGEHPLPRTWATAMSADQLEGADASAQPGPASQDHGRSSDWKSQAAVVREQDTAADTDLPGQARPPTDYSALSECDVIRDQNGDISGVKLVSVRFRCPSARCGHHKWKRNVPESWYREGTVVCDHCNTVVPKPCVRSAEPFIDVV